MASHPRQLRVKARADLEVVRQTHGGLSYYVLKDPVSLRYFRMGQTEYEIFRRLDGKTTFPQIREELGRTSETAEMTLEEIAGFVGRLRQSNLIDYVGSGEDETLYRRAKAKRRAKIKGWLENYVFINFSLVDPDRFFTWLLPYVRFFWTRGFLIAWFLTFCLAVWLAIGHRGELNWGLDRILAPKNLLYLWVAIIIVKTLHEFAHGMTCKYFGGEVHEMGLLLLVFTPCFYCNVSNAWIFMEKSKRLWVSASGIFFEVFIAQLALFGWLLAPPGVLNSIFYNLMTVASVSTILFNANPLLRYDGYYILADFLEMPNLRLNSTMYMAYLAKRYLLRMKVKRDESIPVRERIVFVIYGFCSFWYRIIIVIGIVVIVASRFLVIGVALAILEAWILLFRPVVRTFKYVYFSPETAEVRTKSIAYGCGAAVVLIVVLGLWRAPHSITATCVVEPIDMKVIRAKTPGFVSKVHAHEAERVAANADLLTLENEDLSLQLIKLEKDLILREREIILYRGQGDAAMVKLSERARQQALRDLDWVRQQIAELRIVSPITGTVLTPHLEGLEQSYVGRGQEVCRVGDMTTAAIRIEVHENEITDVEV
ncbi:MAG: hypothetical protein FJ278_00180, partial [Planctomycetes bacterium]|nr:hypothetical protein [Planctomycetota bacterium]